MKNNKTKSTFRNSLIVGLIPISIILVIGLFVVWGLSEKNKKYVDQSINTPEVAHDTVFVKVTCQKNHFEYPPVETKRKKNPVVEQAPEVNTDTTK
jgi:hypothetical protein